MCKGPEATDNLFAQGAWSKTVGVAMWRNKVEIASLDSGEFPRLWQVPFS